MGIKTGSQRNNDAGAFTLIELLLTVALILLLAGAVILHFGSLGDQARLEEGASHLETLFRYARAQAANSGRQVRIVFGNPNATNGGVTVSTNAQPGLASTNSGVQVVWEPDPIDAPGRLEPLPGAQLLVDQINDLVTVQEAGQPIVTKPLVVGGVLESPALLPSFETGITNKLPVAKTTSGFSLPLICYPDGSSDSMRVVVAATGGEDKRLAVVTLSGMTGLSKRSFVSPEAAAASADSLQPDPWEE